MQRIYELVLQDHFKQYNKMLFLAGPRQVGKTTTAQIVAKLFDNSVYLNWDNDNHREIILQGPLTIAQKFALHKLQQQKQLLIFDEIHKYFRWKNFLKGFYDTYQAQTNILVTGSAKLDILRKGGDSLMGRYFLYRMHPCSVAELLALKLSNSEIQPPKEISTYLFNNLFEFSGYPEPLVHAKRRFYNRWRLLAKQNLLKEDLRDLYRIQDLSRVELLATILSNQIGQLFNANKIATQIQISPHTVSSWLNVLSSFYYCFTVKPWFKNINRSLRKQPKIYLWNWAEAKNIGARYENFIASHLLKAVHYWTDGGFGEYQLYFLRDKDQREVDFLVTKDNQPWFLVEAKYSKTQILSSQLKYFQQQTQAAHAFQVVYDLPYVNSDCFQYHDPTIVPAKTFLAQLV